MCTFSIVYDHFEKQFPFTETWPRSIYPDEAPPVDKKPYDLAKVLEDFRKASEAAKTVDELTGQADCVDPVKARLEARVAELEALLTKPPEFVILKGGNVTPGRYRIIDGLLYRLVDQDQV